VGLQLICYCSVTVTYLRFDLQVLVDAVVHAVNKDYTAMAGDFVRLGFLSKGTDVTPIVPALEKIWADSMGQSLSDFNFRTVTSRFNELVYQYPIRIPERYSLVIRSLLTQEGICLTLDPSFHFLEVAYPYVAKRLLTDDTLRDRLIQVRLRTSCGYKMRSSKYLILVNILRNFRKSLKMSCVQRDFEHETCGL
jgi:predicted unusual protein kinase regulating ubiquinone biosynthesis (AarF/ABC1/UbiB family)